VKRRPRKSLVAGFACFGVVAFLVAGCGGAGSSTGKAGGNRSSRRSSGSNRATDRCVDLWNFGAANADAIQSDLAQRYGSDAAFHFRTRASIYPTPEGCTITILDVVGMFQRVEQPQPGQPGNKVFIPPITTGEGEIDPANVQPKMMHWNVTVHPDGTIDSSSVPPQGAASGHEENTIPPAGEERSAILSVIKQQPELKATTLRNFRVRLASADPRWALASFLGVDAQGSTIGTGLELVHLAASEWRVVQGPGSYLDDCHVPSAVRRQLGVGCS
jgi:hypothetical protein